MIKELAAVLVMVGVVCVVTIVNSGAHRRSANEQRRELAAKLWARAFASYAIDMQDRIVPAAPNWGWVHGNPIPAGSQMYPPDPLAPGRRIESAKVYSYHMIAGRGVPLEAMQADAGTLEQFLSRSIVGGVVTPNQLILLPDYSAQAAIGWHTTFGMNGVFVGGSYRHGSFQAINGTEQPTMRIAVKKLASIQNPATLLSFVAARGGDVMNTTYWNWGAQYPNTHTFMPGYWLVTPPKAGGLTSFNVMNWSVADSFNALAVPSNWGNVNADLVNSKALVIACDGHNETLSLGALRDMRRWANQATGPDWQWSVGQNATPKP